MKYVILVLIYLSLIQNLYGQRSAFHDANYLKSIIDANNGKFKIHPSNRPIFNYYYGSGYTDSQLTSLLGENVFLAPYFEPPGMQNMKFNMVAGGALKAIGGLDVTHLADGFARFIVKRTKAELTMAFFEKFKNTISKTEYEDIRTLFPQTYRTFSVMGTELYNYNAYLNLLRECFAKDLSSLSANYPRILDNHPEIKKNYPELYASMKSAFYIAKEVENIEHPGNLIANFPEQLWKDVDTNFYSSIRVLKLISASLRDTMTQGNYWVNKEKLNLFLANEDAFKIYLGLISAQAP